MGLGYYTLVRVTDYGPFVTKLILPLPDAAASAGKTGSWSVFVRRCDSRGNVLQLPKNWLARDEREPSMGYCTVRDSYPSELDGERREKGSCVTLELAYGPQHALTAEISAPDGVNVYVKSRYTIVQTADMQVGSCAVGGLVYDEKLGTLGDDAHGFVNEISHDAEQPLGYGWFAPQTPGDKKPLIVWLHGAGEGGADPTIAYTGNKVTAMAQKPLQEKFGAGGAYLFVPQCPTMWMDNGTHEYTRTGQSMYTRALKSAIDEFVSHHADIDRTRIYIGGDSNGGFMTMRMAIDYPDFFAAAFPACEALFDETISDEQIRRLAKLPIWFIHSKDDPIVSPYETAVPTYERLKKAGAANVHFTFWDKVEDIHGAFDQVDGKPFQYIGHFVWIPLYNDDCRLDYDGSPVLVNGQEAGVFDWLAAQKRAD